MNSPVTSAAGLSLSEQTMRTARYFVVVLALAAQQGCATATQPESSPVSGGLSTRNLAFLDTLEHRTFSWFWEKTNASNGLTPDRWPTKSFSSVAAIGF